MNDSQLIWEAYLQEGIEAPALFAMYRNAMGEM